MNTPPFSLKQLNFIQQLSALHTKQPLVWLYDIPRLYKCDSESHLSTVQLILAKLHINLILN